MTDSCTLAGARDAIPPKSRRAPATYTQPCAHRPGASIHVADFGTPADARPNSRRSGSPSVVVDSPESNVHRSRSIENAQTSFSTPPSAPHPPWITTHGLSSATRRRVAAAGSSSRAGTTTTACPNRPGGHAASSGSSPCPLPASLPPRPPPRPRVDARAPAVDVVPVVERRRVGCHAHVSTSYRHTSSNTPLSSHPPKIQTSPRLPPYDLSSPLSSPLRSGDRIPSSSAERDFEDALPGAPPLEGPPFGVLDFGSSWRTMLPMEVHRAFSPADLDGATYAAPAASRGAGAGACGSRTGDCSQRASTFLPLHPAATDAVECSSRIHASPRCAPSAPLPPKTKALLDAMGTSAWPPRGGGATPPKGTSARHRMFPSMRKASPRGSPSAPGGSKVAEAAAASCAKPP